LDTGSIQVVLIVATMVALFSEDIRLLMGKGADPPFWTFTVVV
jgi:hypothetical protein